MLDLSCCNRGGNRSPRVPAAGLDRCIGASANLKTVRLYLRYNVASQRLDGPPLCFAEALDFGS